VTRLDHVALWVAERDAIADFALGHLGMHVIERTDRFTLVGADARRGKLTLFAAPGPRAPGQLEHVALRVPELRAALARLPGGLDVEERDGLAAFEVGEGLRIALVEAPTDVEYDLDHVALVSADPEQTAKEYTELGFNPAEPSDGHPRVEVGGAYVEFHRGDPGEPEKPLLNHVAVLVDEVDPVIAEAEKREIVDNVVDAANTRAVFVWGPERVRIEYVEHKPGFALQ
jgi:catechol 2,3-dioxygenase-like lactoylglutathione lyase family enzyme